MSGEKHDARQWYLRTGDKTVFGPVPTRGFVVWAEQGRILPGHEVSCDRKTWTPAEQVPELGISWYVDDGAGNLRGPLNRVAAEQILKSDKAPAGARLVDAKDADPARVMRPAEPVATPDPAPPASRKEAAGRAPGEVATDASRLIEDRDARIARLKQTVEKLERDLADARNLPLLGVTPETPAAAPAPSAKEKAALAALQQSLEEAQESARRERTGRERAQTENQAQLAERDREIARLKAAEAENQTQLAARDREIARLKAAEAELLAFANTRDAELRARTADLEAQLAAAASNAGRGSLSRAPEHDDLLRHVLTEEIDTLDKDLTRERESSAAFRDLSAQRQEALQARMQELTRLLRGDSTAPGSHVVRDHARNFETSRLEAELEALRRTHERVTRQAEERESELQARVRDLGIEQKHRAVEREQYQINEQALLRRIEELERQQTGGTPPPAPVESLEPLPSDNRIFRVMPWMRLRR